MFAISHPSIEGGLAGREQRFESPFTRPDGRSGRALVSVIPRFDGDGEVPGFVMQVLDATTVASGHRVPSVAALVYDCMLEGVVVADPDGPIVAVNPAFTTLTGYASAEVVGSASCHLGFEGTSDATRSLIRREVVSRGVWRGDVWCRRKNGESFLAEQTVTLAPHGLDGRSAHIVTFFRDVTEARRDLHRLSQMARRDALTGLDNRSVILERLDELTQRSGRTKASFAVLFIDLDGFKTVNDRCGHDVGDMVLQVIAMRLTASVRQQDLVARLAGDEFLVILEGRDIARGAAEAASRIREAVGRPIPFGDRTISVEASVGQAMFPEDSVTAPGLIARADARMYRMKNERKR